MKKTIVLSLFSLFVASTSVADYQTPIDETEVWANPLTEEEIAACDNQYWECLNNRDFNDYQCEFFWHNCLDGLPSEIEIYEEYPVEDTEIFDPPPIVNTDFSLFVASTSVADYQTPIDETEVWANPLTEEEIAACDNQYWECLNNRDFNDYQCEFFWHNCLDGLPSEIEIYEEYPIEDTEIFDPPL
jgi:hypothetical protein